ncbi:hypothetical protein HRbin28_00001 [bacterium HR28]|nr:hypothetical protein HRbin28_00001 [bacterium HR28]
MHDRGTRRVVRIDDRTRRLDQRVVGERTRVRHRRDTARVQDPPRFRISAAPGEDRRIERQRHGLGDLARHRAISNRRIHEQLARDPDQCRERLRLERDRCERHVRVGDELVLVPPRCSRTRDDLRDREVARLQADGRHAGADRDGLGARQVDDEGGDRMRDQRTPAARDADAAELGIGPGVAAVQPLAERHRRRYRGELVLRSQEPLLAGERVSRYRSRRVLLQHSIEFRLELEEATQFLLTDVALLAQRAIDDRPHLPVDRLSPLIEILPAHVTYLPRQ